MKNSQIYTVNIDDLAYGGEGVAHPENHPVMFVRGALPGEKVKVKPYRKKKNYWRAELVEIVKPAASRVDPPCPVYEKCGGCQLQHMRYPAQLKGKKSMIVDALERIGEVENLPDFQVEGMEFPWYYRNKGQFPVGLEPGDEGESIRPGFFRSGSHELVFFSECLIQHQPINRLLQKSTEYLNEFAVEPYQENKHRGNLRHLVVRSSVCTSQLQLTFVTRKNKMKGLEEIAAGLHKDIRSLWGVYHNINPEETNVILGEENHLVSGERFITEYLGNKKFLIHPASFFQVNTLQARNLYDIIQNMALRYSADKIIDAYCGTGSIAVYIAGKAEKIVGIEEVPQSILAAKKNAQLNDCQDRLTFVQGRVENVLPSIDASGSIIIVDPPRSGLSRDCVEKIMNAKPLAIIYVSCQPNTLARDIKRLKDGYFLKDLAAVDMFPQTYHVESAALLEHRN